MVGPTDTFVFSFICHSFFIFSEYFHPSDDDVCKCLKTINHLPLGLLQWNCVQARKKARAAQITADDAVASVNETLTKVTDIKNILSRFLNYNQTTTATTFNMQCLLAAQRANTLLL